MGSGPSVVITYPYPIGQKAAGGSRTTKEVARHLARAGADVVIMPVSTNPLSRSFPRTVVNESELGLEHDADLARDHVDVIRPAQNPLAYPLDGTSVKSATTKISGQSSKTLIK